MSKVKDEIREISDLPHYKDEYKEQLAGMGIETLPDLLEALYDEGKKQEIIDELKGVGPKIADHWIDIIEERGVIEGEVAEEAVPAAEPPAEVEEAPKAEEEAVIIEEPEAPKEGEVVEKGGYVAKAKPELDPIMMDLLEKRRSIGERRPAFLRQEWFRYKKLGEKWRRPKGIHSKMRRHYKYRPPVVSIGYGSPRKVRGLHPSGFEEVMVHNKSQLDGIDPKRQAVRIGGGVGYRKRLEIETKADELGIRVLNRTG